LIFLRWGCAWDAMAVGLCLISCWMDGGVGWSEIYSPRGVEIEDLNVLL
jgi:hypothetical protein